MNADMAGASTTLRERVEALSQEEAIEAALALAQELNSDADETPFAKNDFAVAVAQAPYAHLPELADLARAVLATAGATQEWGEHVEEILDAVGRKAFIFGTAELITLSVAGVLALSLILGRGKSEEKEKMSVDEKGTFTYERKTVYATGPGLAKALAKILGRYLQP